MDHFMCVWVNLARYSFFATDLYRWLYIHIYSCNFIWQARHKLKCLDIYSEKDFFIKIACFINKHNATRYFENAV